MLKTQNLILPTCDSFPLIVSQLCVGLLNMFGGGIPIDQYTSCACQQAPFYQMTPFLNFTPYDPLSLLLRSKISGKIITFWKMSENFRKMC